MATHGTLYIKSNDGTADAGTLAIYDASGASLITVTATGATSDFSGADAYTYGGNKEFLGFAEVANATEPTYAIGDTFYASGEGTVYIVEAEEPTTSGVTVEYDGSVVATIENGNKATIPIAGKKMKSDIVITVPEATDSPLPIEVSTEAEMTALLTSGEVGGVYKYVGETTEAYENGALYVLEEEMYTISVTTDGAVRGIDSITHVKFNSPPTSADDYDRTSEDGSATVTASKAYIWGGGYILNDGGETYTYDYDYSTAKEVIFTQDSSLSIVTLYASSGGSN